LDEQAGIDNGAVLLAQRVRDGVQVFLIGGVVPVRVRGLDATRYGDE